MDADPKSEISMVNIAQQAKNRSMAIKGQADELSLRDLESERLKGTISVNELKETLQDSMKLKLAISKFGLSFTKNNISFICLLVKRINGKRISIL